MIGRHRGLIAHLKRVSPDLFTIHCTIHRQHLVAKNLSAELHKSLNFVIKAVNQIKTHPLTDRLFRQLCHANEEDFERLLLHTEVRWLSKGICLQRFYCLFDSAVQFLNEVGCGSLAIEVETRKHDIAYLTDFFSKLNEVQLKLQGCGTTLVQSKSVIVAFINKLNFFRVCLERGDLQHFPNLLKANLDSKVGDEQVSRYCGHLENVKMDMETRFHDLSSLHVPDWFIDPFLTDPLTQESQFQEHLIDLQHDVEAKACFGQVSYPQFWIKFRYRFPALWNKIKLLILAFPTSYLVEKGFSAVNYLVSKQRNRINVVQRGDLRLFLTKKQPDVVKLVNEHQAQGSH